MRTLHFFSISIGVVVSFFGPALVNSQDDDLVLANELRSFGQLLHDPVMIHELDLTNEQQRNIRELAKWHSEASREALLLGGVEGANYNEAQRAIHNTLNLQLEEALLPHQLERVYQLHRQRMIGPDDQTFGVLHDSVKPKLELTDDQVGEIQDVAEEVQEELQLAILELQQRIIELKSNARKEVLEVLTPEQRARYFELVGEDPVVAGIWLEHARKETVKRINELRERENSQRQNNDRQDTDRDDNKREDDALDDDKVN